jgi:hypothetical protein
MSMINNLLKIFIASSFITRVYVLDYILRLTLESIAVLLDWICCIWKDWWI